MTVNNADLLFSSNWDIDQIYQSGQATLTAAANTGYPGTSSLVATHNLGYVPVADFVFNVDGASQWNQMGATVGLLTVWSYITTTGFYAVLANSDSVAHTVVIDYQIWTDTVIY